MALKTIKNDGSPPIARHFDASTAAVLHDDDAPVGCKHLPAGVFLEDDGAGEGADLVWVDATGTTVTTAIPAGAAGRYLPIAPAELDASNAVAVTVFWHRGATR